MRRSARCSIWNWHDNGGWCRQSYSSKGISNLSVLKLSFRHFPIGSLFLLPNYKKSGHSYANCVPIVLLSSHTTQIQASVPSTIALSEASSPDDFPSDAGDATSNTLPPVHPSIDLTYLFGHAPSPDHQTLYSSYAAQIAALVWTSERHGQVGSSHIPVVVGVALKSPRSSERPSGTDRATFLQVMDLVRGALGTERTA
jgi:proteasome assembly chaperone 3